MNHNYYFQYTDTNNNLLVVDVEDASSPNNATINCTFLSGFTGSAHCTVQYGTDPTYMNLPYSAVSTETGTAGDSVSLVLRERLNSSTVYYYSVSAVSGDVTVTVQATFTTPQYSMHNDVSITVSSQKYAPLLAHYFEVNMGRKHLLKYSISLVHVNNHDNSCGFPEEQPVASMNVPQVVLVLSREALKKLASSVATP